MSISQKDEQGLLNHEEYQAVQSTHHPAIYNLDKDALRELTLRIERHRDKAQTMARQKRREVKGKAEPRGKSFPGTAEQPTKRKQIFAQALKRLKKERERLNHLEARTANVEAAHRALALRRASSFQSYPASGPSAGTGQQDKGGAPKRVRIPRKKIGSILKANARAQAKRDARPT